MIRSNRILNDFRYDYERAKLYLIGCHIYKFFNTNLIDSLGGRHQSEMKMQRESCLIDFYSSQSNRTTKLMNNENLDRNSLGSISQIDSISNQFESISQANWL